MVVAMRRLLPLLAVVACTATEPAPPPVDADAGIVDAYAVTPPTPPTAANVEPCPAGWVATSSNAITLCEPWANGTPEACGAGEAHYASEVGCVGVGTPCGASDFATDLPATAVIYVRPGAGGDGTEARPYDSIATAIQVATRGDTIAVGKGTYDESINIPEGVSVVGACVTETRIAPTVRHDWDGAVTMEAPDVTLRNLTLTGARIGVTVRGTTTTASLRDLIIDGATSLGVRMSNFAQVEARNIVVRDMQPRPRDGADGRGVQAASSSVLTLERAVIERSRALGLILGFGAVVNATDVVVRGTQPDGAGGPSGRGVHVQDDGTLTLRRSVVEDNGGGGVILLAAEATIEDSIIRHTRARTDGTQGFGVFADDGSKVTMTRTVIDGNRAVGVVVQSPGARVNATDVIVRGTLPQDVNATFGRGFIVQFSAHGDLRRVIAERNHETGIEIGNSATATLTDIIIRDTLPAADDRRAGRGLDILKSAAADVSRIHITRNHTVGTYVTEESVLRLSDFRIEHTKRRACVPICQGDFGMGMSIVDSARVTAIRGLLSHNHLAGLQLAGQANLDLSTAEVSFNPIGANVQISGYDLDRLTDDVVYVKNDANLDAVELPLPDPTNPLPR